MRSSSAKSTSSSGRRPIGGPDRALAPAQRRDALYEDPQLYDLGFGFREIGAECDGILEIAKRHGLASPRRIADIACGPAHHLREFARRNYDSFGIELNAAMLGYARSLCKRDGVSVWFRRADMRSFELPARVDLGLFLFDSFAYCTTDGDAVAALRATAANVRRGGLVVVELTHPADYFRPRHSRTAGRWRKSYPDVVVSTSYATTRIDPVEETYVASMTVQGRYRANGRKRRIVDRQLKRMWLRSGIRHAAAASGDFDIVGWYGDLTPAVAFSMQPSSWRMVAVLRRR